VNFITHDVCRRCGGALVDDVAVAAQPAVEEPPRGGVGRRLLWLTGIIALAIFGWSRSLLLTSESVDANQRLAVLQAVSQLEHAGFSREVLVLRHFANYRVTDNWWNVYLGHHDAYAATNFPLGVVTLYPPFFGVAVDETERAAILLHEAQHLWGASEAAALEHAWREKGRLGWTADKYGDTRVWKNTKEWTAAEVSTLFQCGPGGHADCAP
jgi:hypothetical protein